ncbi:MAG: precorrin-3B C(17)-methyltransferase [Actinomycetota bacterium]|nr:precorrin-3B C(17)-methyltransferase [Actinomycetota bacterium]
MTVLAVSITERGRALAERLPFDRSHGQLAETVRSRWTDVDGFVLFAATGVAVRVVAPLLASKATDPAVVCVDEAGRFAVALCGGHAAGANELARHVAELLDATPVVTTATDATGTPSLDQIPDLLPAGDVAGVTTALLDGRPPVVENPLGWPLPHWLTRPAGDGPERILITDRTTVKKPGLLVLHPPSLVVGVGTSTDPPVEEVEALAQGAVADAGLAWASVAEVATIDRRAGEPAIVGLGRPVRSFAPGELAAVPVPTPSQVVASAVGTPSVAEAAALLATGPDGELLVAKRATAHATVAVARRRRPRGVVAVVGLGPGPAAWRTPAAEAAVRRADVVIGYGPYVDQARSLLSPWQEVVRSPIGEEAVRAKQAVGEAGAGRRVAMVCSGDAGVYAMASVVLEVAGGTGVEVEVVPGVTAGLAASALLGAPLGHDHLVLSLSDLHTPWTAIAARLRAAAETDLVVVLYNPRSRRRTWQLETAKDILLTSRSPGTPVGVVTEAGRPGQRVSLTTLAALDPSTVDMTTCVVVGSSTTRVVNGRMVTPRGLLP